MRDLDAGRIFWKEWRAQRSFLFALLGFAVALEALVTFAFPMVEPIPAPVRLGMGQVVVIVLACAFATGSSAIAFAGEVEGKTKGLLQRLPVRTRGLLVGKVFWTITGSYVLLLAVWLLLALVTLPPVFLSADSGSKSEVIDGLVLFSRFLLTPLLCAVVGSLVSLLLSDVLITVLVTVCAAGVLIAVIQERPEWQAAVAALVVVVDAFLARKWLKASGAVRWAIVPRFTMPRLTHRIRGRVKESARPLESVRSAVAWRRAASSLLWKEFRQAFPFCLKLFVAALLSVLVIPVTEHFTSSHSGESDLKGLEGFAFIAPMLAPFLAGIAAIRAERRGSVYQFLTNRGIGPHGFFVCKQLMWLALVLAMIGFVLAVDWTFTSDPASPGKLPSLWDVAAGAANATFDSPITSVVRPALLAAFYVFLLFELGYVLGVFLRGPIIAFFAGGFVWALVAGGWGFATHLRIPFSWTIGLVPVIFLAASWVRTPDWMAARGTLRTASKAFAVLVVPFAGILIAIAVYRVVEIPAAEIPAALLETARQPDSASPFAAALKALSGSPPQLPPAQEELIQFNGWAWAPARQKLWVEQNAAAIKLALEAAKGQSGPLKPRALSDADEPRQRSLQHESQVALAELLLFRARMLEWENRLDEALSCYVAVARLSGQTFTSLDWMRKWAAYPTQSTERIQTAIREFELLHPQEAPFSPGVLRAWRVNRALLRSVLSEHSPSKSQAVCESWWVRRFLPWEIVRVERLEDAMYASDLEQVAAIERDLNSRGFVTMTAERAQRLDDKDADLSDLELTTLAPPPEVTFPAGEPARAVDEVALERLELIAVALVDYQREHKQYPHLLAALVPTYFQQLPVDPWTGRNFLYEPQGLPRDTEFKYSRYPPRITFVASAGVRDTSIVRKGGEQAALTLAHRFPRKTRPFQRTGNYEFSGAAVALPPPTAWRPAPEPNAAPLLEAPPVRRGCGK